MSRRGASTPTGSLNKNRSCNYSPITNLDFSKSSVGSTDRLEPKLLKPLGEYANLQLCLLIFLHCLQDLLVTRLSSIGPTFPQSSTEKKSASKAKFPIEDQATLLYMTYQQQHFLNNQLEESKESVLADCKVKEKVAFTIIHKNFIHSRNF